MAARLFAPAAVAALVVLVTVGCILAAEREGRGWNTYDDLSRRDAQAAYREVVISDRTRGIISQETFERRQGIADTLERAWFGGGDGSISPWRELREPPGK